ncbi:hypothetical protein BTVI_35271 [Pitangus sulphuratus]|nr:hypothetical protein BTVI_35271 [Pitangus sulphuratus]
MIDENPQEGPSHSGNSPVPVSPTVSELVPASHSPSCPPSRLEAQTISGRQLWAAAVRSVLAAPQINWGALDEEEEEWEEESNLDLSEVGDDSIDELLQAKWEDITIHTIWVNPLYPQLLQVPDTDPQEWAQAAASLGSREQVTEAGAERQLSRRRPSRFRRLLRALRRLFRWFFMMGRPEED